MANIKPPPNPEPDEPFEKFKRLTGQLLQVPKKEVDKKQVQYEKEREKVKSKKRP